MSGSSALENAFRLLEAGKEYENSNNLELARSSFHQACQLIRDIIQFEHDRAKRSLLIDQLQYYEEKVRILVMTIERKQADAALDKALSLDEKKGKLSDVESLYLEAAEKYMNCLKIKDDNAMKIRVKGILDRVEELRNVEKCADNLPSIDPSRPLTSGGARKPSENATVSQSAPGPPPHCFPPHVESLSSGSSNGLTPEEISVLRGSSVISGRCFMPWLDGEEKREVYTFNMPFVDPDGPLQFSESQLKHQPVYRRIADISKEAPAVMIRRVSPLSIYQDLVPDCSFVCSLCIAAAYEARHRKQLITAIVYPQNERGVPVINPSGKYLVKLHINGVPRKVIVDDFLPVSGRSGRLLCSSSRDSSEMWVSIVEKAYMKLNGGYDFPGSNSGIDLHALTGWIPEQVFFSEDSSTPVSSARQDHRQSEDRAWERILSAHNLGDCLITISTPPMTPQEEEATGLVPGHAYAVLSVQSVGNLRMLQVKNPWARQTWRGRFSSVDRDTWTPGLRQALGVSLEDFDKMDDHGIFWIEFGDCRRVFRSFFLNWNPTLFKFRTTLHGRWPVSQGPRFDTYYKGANPQYYLRLDGSMGAGAAVAAEMTPSSSVVWILLTRHVVSVEEEKGTQGDGAEDDDTYLTLHVYKGGKRIYSPSTPDVKGVYSSDRHILTRIDISSIDTQQANERSLEHPMGQTDKRRDVSYTLAVYSTALPFVCVPCSPLPTNQLRVRGMWTESNAGGHNGSPTFYTNPQYRLTINGEKGFDFHIQAMYGKDISASISVINPKKNYTSSGAASKKNGGERGGEERSRVDCIVSDSAEEMTSGNYRDGFCYCATDRLKPGEYVVILSCYDTSARGPFELTLATTAGGAPAGESLYNKKYFSLKEIAPEGHAMKRFTCSGEWKSEDQTAAGCSNFLNYNKNPLYVMQTSTAVVMTCRLKVSSGTVHGVNVSVYRGDEYLLRETFPIESVADARQETDETLASEQVDSTPNSEAITYTSLRPSCSLKNALYSSGNGAYVVRPVGASIQNVELPAGTYAFVPSTFEPICCKYDLDIYVGPVTACSSGFSVKRIR